MHSFGSHHYEVHQRMNLCNFDVLALHDFSSSADITGQ